jgi:hypothetical protein
MVNLGTGSAREPRRAGPLRSAKELREAGALAEADVK